jgi:hypothetical protein
VAGRLESRLITSRWTPYHLGAHTLPQGWGLVVLCTDVGIGNVIAQAWADAS